MYPRDYLHPSPRSRLLKPWGSSLQIPFEGANANRLLDIFPPSLETLPPTRFHSESNQLLEALECVLAYKSLRQVPSLKTLILEEIIIVYNNGMPPTRPIDIMWGEAHRRLP